jgi:hypothetical protein
MELRKECFDGSRFDFGLTHDETCLFQHPFADHIAWMVSTKRSGRNGGVSRQLILRGFAGQMRNAGVQKRQTAMLPHRFRDSPVKKINKAKGNARHEVIEAASRRSERFSQERRHLD